MRPNANPRGEERQWIRGRIRSVHTEVATGVVSVSASVGIAVFPTDGDTYEDPCSPCRCRMYD